ncbi:MAG TPA: hypothetical protein VGJ20_35625 [Xanthobacteraceae bacterium]|jgi:hypothetical protein
MDIFRRENPSHLVPIHPDNVASKDWIVLLEASTIIGPSPDRLRVAQTTQQRKIVRKFASLRRQPFLVVDSYDPRIHVLYFCPQLYKYDSDDKLVPLSGEEIGKFVAQAVEGHVKTRRPWYDPLEKLPDDRVVTGDLVTDLDTLVIEKPGGWRALAPPSGAARATG